MSTTADTATHAEVSVEARLATAVEALEAVPWDVAPGVSVAEAAALTARVEEAREAAAAGDSA